MINRRSRYSFKTPGTSSPRNSSRGCLCENNTYHVDCCDGSLMAQGIGNVYGFPHLLTEKGLSILQENFGKIGIEGVPPYIPPPLTPEEQQIIDDQLEAERLAEIQWQMESDLSSNNGPSWAQQEAYEEERNLNHLPNGSNYTDR